MHKRSGSPSYFTIWHFGIGCRHISKPGQVTGCTVNSGSERSNHGYWLLWHPVHNESGKAEIQSNIGCSGSPVSNMYHLGRVWYIAAWSNSDFAGECTIIHGSMRAHTVTAYSHCERVRAGRCRFASKIHMCRQIWLSRSVLCFSIVFSALPSLLHMVSSLVVSCL